MAIRTVSATGREWLLTEILGSGSEGVVYAVDGEPGLAAKLVPDPPDRAEYRRRIERLVRQRHEPRTIRLLSGTPQRLAWPLVRVTTVSGGIDGYLMPNMSTCFQPFDQLLSASIRREPLNAVA